MNPRPLANFLSWTEIHDEAVLAEHSAHPCAASLWARRGGGRGEDLILIFLVQSQNMHSVAETTKAPDNRSKFVAPSFMFR